MPRLTQSQATNFEKRFERGFLPRIRRLLTTLPVMLITLGLLPGLLRVLHIMNGKQGDHSCGCTGSVSLSVLFVELLLMDSDFSSGLGKERTMVGDSDDSRLRSLYLHSALQSLKTLKALV
jgi:hypothetical protein